MSQHMHAPGPWIARYEPDDGGEFAIQAANGIQVALTIGNTRSEAANALVIAAAPDMLEAAQAAWNCIAELPPTQARVEVAQLLQEAIEKAIGAEI